MLLAVTLLTAAACDRIHINPSSETDGGTTGTTSGSATATTTGTTVAPTPTPEQTTVPSTTPPTTAGTTAPLPDRAGTFGNTAGNLVNGGFAAWDSMTARHLISAGGMLVLHDPATGQTDPVWSPAAGDISHINIGTDYYYFITSGDLAFWRLSRAGGTPEALVDADCTFAGRYEHYLQVQINGVLHWIDGDDAGAPDDIHSGVVAWPTLGYSRVYYQAEDGEIRVSANTGMGRTRVYGGQAFTAMHHFFLAADQTFLYVDQEGNSEQVFVLENGSDPEPFLSRAFGRISALAAPSAYMLNEVYLIAEDAGGAGLYRATAEDTTPVKLLDLEHAEYLLNIVDHTLYLKDPATLEVFRVSENADALMPVTP